ncbi:MAG: phosphate ABC transporter permease subunit PstC [Vulcanisaeta sp.]|nr:phosphate ABC transporter permease subunit PstC [Vulcanisaeta sp.]
MKYGVKIIKNRHWPLSSLSILIVTALVGAMLVALIYYSLPALMREGLSVYTTNRWDPNANFFGGFAAVYGTFIVSLVAITIAMPLAVGSAIFINEFAPDKLRGFLIAINDMMASFPTVIYGLWGLYVLGPTLNPTLFTWLHSNLGFIPLFSTKPIGGSYLLAATVLAIMITPFASSLVREVYAQVPSVMVEGIYALGLTKWDAIRIKLSYIAKSLLGALSLALGRGIGETVAVALTVGGVLKVSPSLLSPGITIPSLIANQFGSAYTQIEQSALLSLALLLFIIGLTFITMAKLVLLRGGAR